MFWMEEEARALKHGDSLCGEAYFSMWEDNFAYEQSGQDIHKAKMCSVQCV